MNHWIGQHKNERPHDAAFYVGQRCISYGELAHEASSLAAGLAELGIGLGIRVGVQGANSADWIFALHAIWWRGATVVPLHDRLGREALQRHVEAADVDLLLSEEAPSAVAKEVSHCTFNELRELGCDPIGAEEMDASDVATILLTSGSTGTPRAVPATVENHMASANASAKRLGRRADDRWLCVLPLCHIGGLAIAIRSAIYGTSFDLMKSFDTSSVAHRLVNQPITLASFVPTMLRRLLDDYENAFDTSLRAVLVGGGPAGGDELRRARRRGLPVVSTYGMTEACSQLATLAPDAHASRLHTAGRPLPGVELMIANDERRPTPAGTPGMLWARGSMLCDGYLEMPDDRAPDSFVDGWFRTGDIGSLDDDGFLTIHCRAGDRIITGGENVDPREVEAVLRAVDGVEDVAVLGVDDEHWGQLVACAVVASQQLHPRLVEVSRQRLASFQIPRRWSFMPRLPKTASGKIDGMRLREQMASHQRDTLCSEDTP